MYNREQKFVLFSKSAEHLFFLRKNLPKYAFILMEHCLAKKKQSIYYYSVIWRICADIRHLIETGEFERFRFLGAFPLVADFETLSSSQQIQR
jgi:hypothetical protein